jgi:hypothetical protein
MRLVRTLVPILAVALFAGAAGCSGSSVSNEPHQVKDLKSRGLKPDAEEGAKEASKPDEATKEAPKSDK